MPKALFGDERAAELAAGIRRKTRNAFPIEVQLTSTGQAVLAAEHAVEFVLAVACDARDPQDIASCDAQCFNFDRQAINIVVDVRCL